MKSEGKCERQNLKSLEENIKLCCSIQCSNNKKPRQLNQNTGRRSKQTFSKEDAWMANRYLKRCSESLILREMQVKTTARHHFTPVRMSITTEFTNNECWRGCGAKGTLLTLLVGMEIDTAIIENSMQVPEKKEKQKIQLPYDPAIPLLGIYQKKMKTLLQKDTCINGHSRTVYNSQDTEAT